MNKNINQKIKKVIAITLILACTGSMVACSSNKEESTNGENQTQNDVKSEEKDNQEDAVAEKSGSIITLGDRAFEIFYGNEEVAKKYSETISNHKENLGEDVDVYNMVIPTHVEFGLDEEYKDMSNSQREVIDDIYSNMTEDILTVNVYDTLEKHKDEYIYFNTDHHWTSLGAYYAYEEFAKEAGFDKIDLDNYKKYTKEDFLGTFYTQTNDKNLKQNPDKVDYYKIDEDYKVYRYEDSSLENPQKTTLYADYASGPNAYSLFLHGDFPMIKIENEKSENDKKIVVVKESYGNAFVPFLIPHYKEILVVDPRHYEGSLNDIVKDNSIDEVLFINNVFATNTESIVNKIENLNQ